MLHTFFFNLKGLWKNSTQTSPQRGTGGILMTSSLSFFLAESNRGDSPSLVLDANISKYTPVKMQNKFYTDVEPRPC